MHPGAIQTELARHMEPGALDQFTFQYKTIPQGAATSVWAAVVASADAIGGRYCENCHVGQVVADELGIKPSRGGSCAKRSTTISARGSLSRGRPNAVEHRR